MERPSARGKTIPINGMEMYNEVGSFFQKPAENIDSEAEVGRLIDAGDHVVMVGRSRGRVRSNAKDFEVAAVHIWKLSNGKAIRFEAYIDTPGSSG
jgi:ketosteroid isomerase-like protein